jgi:hypothetical protein
MNKIEKMNLVKIVLAICTVLLVAGFSLPSKFEIIHCHHFPSHFEFDVCGKEFRPVYFNFCGKENSPLKIDITHDGK